MSIFVCVPVDMLKYKIHSQNFSGSWGYRKQFSEWSREQLVKEKLVEAIQTTGGEVPLDRLLKAVTVVREDDARRKKRALDKVYARRKRQRHRTEEQDIREAIQRLQQEKIVLLARHGALQQLSQRAAQIVQILEQNSRIDPFLLRQKMPALSSPLSFHSLTQQQEYAPQSLEALMLQQRLRQAQLNPHPGVLGTTHYPLDLHNQSRYLQSLGSVAPFATGAGVAGLAGQLIGGGTATGPSLFQSANTGSLPDDPFGPFPGLPPQLQINSQLSLLRRQQQLQLERNAELQGDAALTQLLLSRALDPGEDEDQKPAADPRGAFWGP